MVRQRHCWGASGWRHATLGMMGEKQLGRRMSYAARCVFVWCNIVLGSYDGYKLRHDKPAHNLLVLATRWLQHPGYQWLRWARPCSEATRYTAPQMLPWASRRGTALTPRQCPSGVGCLLATNDSRWPGSGCSPLITQAPGPAGEWHSVASCEA